MALRIVSAADFGILSIQNFSLQRMKLGIYLAKDGGDFIL